MDGSMGGGMNRSRGGNFGRFGFFGQGLTLRQRDLFRQLYHRCMIAVGCAALLLSVGLQAASFGLPGLRRLAEGLVFSGEAAAAQEEPPKEEGEGREEGDGDGDELSLFFPPFGGSPTGGDFPLGGLLATPPDAPAPDASPADDAADIPGDADKTPAPPADGDDDGNGGGSAIIPRDLSATVPFSLLNMTSTLDPDLEKIYGSYMAAEKEPAPQSPEGAPLVLILHTHSTEAYAPEGAVRLPAGGNPRSIDPEESVVAVGAVLAETLQAKGIPTIHCTFGHDLEDYTGAYDREKQTILAYLEKYPSIRYIFDVHRDSIEGSGGSTVKTAARAQGETVAQLMLVVGTNERGANHPHWEKNLGYALALQAALSSAHPGLMRAVNLRGASFNEQYTPCSLLLEVGAAGNTLHEAKRAAALFGNAVAAEILGA